MSLNFVLDASLVPETCPLQFDDALSAETEPGFAVKVGNLLFPAFVRPARWEFHQLPQVHPANGTGACWARSLKPGLRTKVGRLTAKHVVGQRILGNPVPLTKGLGRLLDAAPEGIDAALIQVPRAQLPPYLHAFGAQTHIAQWIDVQVYGRESGVFQTKVTEVTPSRCPGMYSLHARPMGSTERQRRRSLTRWTLCASARYLRAISSQSSSSTTSALQTPFAT